MLDFGNNPGIIALCIGALLTESEVRIDLATGKAGIAHPDDEDNEGGICVALDSLAELSGAEWADEAGVALRKEYRDQGKALTALATINGHLQRLLDSADASDRRSLIEEAQQQVAAVIQFLQGLKERIVETTPTPAEVGEAITSDCRRLGEPMLRSLLTLLGQLEPSARAYVIEHNPTSNLIHTAAC